MTRIRPTCCAEAGRPPARFAVEERRIGSRVVVTVLGEVDISTVDDLRYALESARDAPAAEIWLDLSAATFFDCRGLSTLLELRPGLLAGNRRLAVICPPGPVRRLLDLTGADSELEIHSSPAAATRPWRPRIAR